MDKETIKEIGLRIAKLRIEKNISQKELGYEVGVSRDIINSYETGRRAPKLESIVNLAVFFDVSADYLLCITNNPTIKHMDNNSIVSDICDYTGLSMEAINKLHTYIEEDKKVKREMNRTEAINKSIRKENGEGPNSGEIIDVFFPPSFCLPINRFIENEIFLQLSDSVLEYMSMLKNSKLKEHYLDNLRKNNNLLDEEIYLMQEKYNNEFKKITGSSLFSKHKYDDKKYMDYLEYCISKEFISFLEKMDI